MEQKAYGVASRLCIIRSVKLSHGRNDIEKLYLIDKVDSFMKDIKDLKPSVLFERIPGLEGQLIQLVTNDPNLTELFLFGQNLKDNDAKIIALALRGNTSLIRLILIKNEIGDDGAIALANSLEGNSSLEKLFLSSNNIGDDGAIALANAFEGNTSLEILSISHNQFGDNGAQALNNVHAIQRN